jgi:CheY-like chemotaxis protein
VLAGGVAHDFNNILAAVVGNLSLAMTTRRPDLLHDVLADIEKATLRAQKLVGQLATFSRGGAPVRRTVRIARLIRDATVFALSGSNVTCEFSLAEDLSPVSVDEGQMGQVIDNLVINAKQAMPQGGTLRIGAANATVDARDALARLSVRPGRYVRIVVEDRGTGIAKEHLPRIFDPYFTTKEKGTGLGLATTYAVVKRHDGHIGVESRVGVGTTFTIFLPASDEAPAPVLEATPARAGQGRVLLMDDDEMILDATGRMLRHLGYAADCARSGQEAVSLYRAARDRGRPFDAVIMDLTIPAGMGGKDAFAALRELDPNVTAIVSSGYADEPVLADHRRHGFAGALPKPYTLRELGEVLHESLARRCARAG